jgi:predicted RNA binding protein YcfA (HicA-like mRNA interferase family)
MSVKRNEFLQHLSKHQCFLQRHGSKHDIYKNNLNNKQTTVPRHPKLDKFLCDAICKQLEIPKP